MNKQDAKIFLTDYASYNEGTQFEFGHWLSLDQFSDAEELSKHITSHFEECDTKRPLLCGSAREEIMITDYEGFPEDFYSECMDFEELFNFFEAVENIDLDSNEGWLELHNNYCNENNMDDYIHCFDDDFFTTYFNESPIEAARAASFGDLNWSHEYIIFNGYGNLESFDDVRSNIDESLLINWLIESL